MPPPPFSVAIVGGAFAGTAMLLHLSERLGAKLRNGRMRVSLFERTQEPGTGLAWSGAMASDCQLCNLPVGALSLSDAFRPTFEQWLRETHLARFGADECLAAAYPPRRYFGEYVQAMLPRLVERTGVRLHTDTEVVSIAPLPPRAPRRGPRYRLEPPGCISAIESSTKTMS